MAVLTQEQNEALVRLMIAGRYEDKKLSLLEGSALEARLEQLEWRSGTSRSFFAQQATAVVRKALVDPQGKSDFLKEQCGLFRDDAEARSVALRIIAEVLGCDGTEGRESVFIGQIRSLMGA